VSAFANCGRAVARVRGSYVPLPDSCIAIRLFSGAPEPRARRRIGGIEERLRDVITLADQHHLGGCRIGVG
jgi:hypothetical protein